MPEAFQKQYYRELFDVCLRHAGYVSSRYVHAWLMACVLRPRPWLHPYEERLTRVAQTWFHNRYRCRKSRFKSVLSVLNTERRYVKPFLKRQLAALNPRRWFRRAAAPAHIELGPDLWLGPELTFPHAGGPVRLAGVPARDGVLRVYRGSAEIAAVPLRADEPADVCVEVPGSGPVRLVFSDSEPLPDGRRVAFKLRGTTLFTEGDTRAA